MKGQNHMYTFKILDAAFGQYRVHFRYNAEPIMWSENFTAKTTAYENIRSVKLNALVAPIVDLTLWQVGSGYRFEIDKSGDQFIARFRAINGEIMLSSERYTTKQNAINAALAVKNNAYAASVIDESSSRAA
jgi:uncharacterized protein